MKHVQACLSAKKDGESSFHYCEGREQFSSLCMCEKAILITVEVM